MKLVTCSQCGIETASTGGPCPNCFHQLPIPAPAAPEYFQPVVQNQSSNPYKPYYILVIGVVIVLAVTGLATAKPHTGDHLNAILGSVIALSVLGVIGLFLYFLPTIIAIWNRHPKTVAIFVLNVLAGWTFVGWVVAMVWAFA
jgi:hypothetical protein